MARLKISEFLSFGANAGDIIMTDWRVYENINGEKGELLFSSLNDEVNKVEIIATLMKGGELFDVDRPTIAEVRIRTDDKWKPWYTKYCGEIE